MILRDDHDADWTAAADSTLERRIYYAQNWRADVIALLSDNGRILERVRYEPYGTPFGQPPMDFTGSSDNLKDDYGVPDGDVDSDDFTFFNDATTAGSARADLTESSDDPNATYGRPDGDRNGDDFFYYLDVSADNESRGRDVLSSSDLRNRKGYAGYEWDPGVQAGTPIYHIRNRVYMPDTGRWSRRDPMGYVDGYNLYNYGSSMPQVSRDPTGLYAALVPGQSPCGSHDSDINFPIGHSRIPVCTLGCPIEVILALHDPDVKDSLGRINNCIWRRANDPRMPRSVDNWRGIEINCNCTGGAGVPRWPNGQRGRNYLRLNWCEATQPVKTMLHELRHLEQACTRPHRWDFATCDDEICNELQAYSAENCFHKTKWPFDHTQQKYLRNQCTSACDSASEGCKGGCQSRCESIVDSNACDNTGFYDPGGSTPRLSVPCWRRPRIAEPPRHPTVPRDPGAGGLQIGLH